MSEREIGWYKCIDMEAYLDHYEQHNYKLVEEYFIDGKCEIRTIKFGEGYSSEEEEVPLISLNEWCYFEPCSKPTSSAEPVDYKALFEELLEVTENSDGVAGLHLNNEIATWDELENSDWLPLLKEWKDSVNLLVQTQATARM